MIPLQQRGQKAHSDIDLKLAAEALEAPDDEFNTKLYSAVDSMKKAARHSDITADELGLINSIQAVAEACAVVDVPLDSMYAARTQLARILRRTAERINEREADYGYGLKR